MPDGSNLREEQRPLTPVLKVPCKQGGMMELPHAAGTPQVSMGQEEKRGEC